MTTTNKLDLIGSGHEVCNLNELNAGLSTNPVHKLSTNHPCIVHTLSTARFTLKPTILIYGLGIQLGV
jgi:hypothetical protein